MFVIVLTCSKRYKEFIKFGCTFNKDEKYTGAENARLVEYNIMLKTKYNILLMLIG